MDYEQILIDIDNLLEEIEVLENMYSHAKELVELDRKEFELDDCDFYMIRNDIDHLLANKKEDLNELIEQRKEYEKEMTPEEKAFWRNEGV